MDDEKSSVGHVPSGARWEFDQTVTDVFEDMLERSIPQYRVMRAAVTDLAADIIAGDLGTKAEGHGAVIVDIGCSRGDAMAPLVERFPKASFLGLEISEPMLETARSRFSGMSNVRIEAWDLRKGLPAYRTATVVLSVLTLMFVPIEHRLRLLRRLADMIMPGGALIIVEKILGASAKIDEVMVDRYYAMKAANGYSAEEIERKRMALEGVLVPMAADWNEDMLRRAGFEEIDAFWRWFNFMGWIALR